MRIGMMAGIWAASLIAGCGLAPLKLQDSAAEGGAENAGADVIIGDLRISPGELDFGEVELGERAVQSVILKNIGDDGIVVRRAQLDGDGAFAVESTTALPIELQGGGEVIVELAFSPETADRFAATLELDAATLSEPYAVPVTGEGRDPSASGDGASDGSGDGAADGGGDGGGGGGPVSITPSSVSFPSVEVGGMVYADARITNTSADDLLLTGISGSPSEFSYRRGGEITLPQVFSPGSSRNLSLSWAPGAPGARSGSVRLTFQLADGSEYFEEIAVSGTATEPSCTICEPILNVTTNDTPTTLLVRELISCTRSENVTLSNVGDMDLAITNIYITNDFLATCGTFTLAGNSPQTLRPGGSMGFTVTYTATESCIDVPVASLDTNMLHIINGSAVSDYTIAVSGSATCLF